MTSGFKRVALAIVAASVVGLIGCSTTAGIEASGKKSWDQDGAPRTDGRVSINNPNLSRDIEIVDINSAMVGDMLRAQIVLRSKDRDTVPIQYRFAWFDAQGMEINSNSGSWKPFIVYGRESKTIQGVSPDPRGREFKINIREVEQ